MSNSEKIKVSISSSAAHRGVEKSSTLNRRYVKRPTKLTISDGTENEKEAKKAKKVEVKKSTSKKAKTEKVEKKTEKVEIKKTLSKKADTPKKVEIKSLKSDELTEKATEELLTVIPKIAHIHVETPDSANEKLKIKDDAEIPDVPPAPNPYQAALDARKAENEKKQLAAISSKALKEAAIARALAGMKKPTPASKKELKEESIAERVMLNEMKAAKKEKRADKKSRKKTLKETRHLKKRSRKHVLFALAASTACMIALGVLVKVNLPNISVKVAAVQTGVEATYPGYIPRDFSINDVYTDEETVIINFSGPNDMKFSLAEEKSSWSSSSLLTNYVKNAYGSNYEVIREQGITIYVSASNASWVNKGVFYRITATNGTLTKKQIKNIVTSL
ncbi:hypothetical protein IJI76_00890 [Candidatus Saccharibacteria bacterium]|nr:hypothetical protein [Candidatus Saccharibacteria bacterium]